MPDHFDLICLITHSPLRFGHFVWWPIRAQNKLPDQLGLGLRPICLITSTLFAWSVIPCYLSADLCDNLFEHKTMFTTAIFACSTVHEPTTHPHISMSFDQFAWSRRPYLPDHLFLVTFWLTCVITYSNTKQTINFDQFAWSRRPYLPDHVDLICLITYSSLHFGWFARWLVQKFFIEIIYCLSPLCIKNSLLKLFIIYVITILSMLF